jgi:hypothetical protein
VDEPLWVYDLLPQLGVELKEENFSSVGSIIDRLSDTGKYAESIRTAREIFWQSRGHAAEAVVDYIISKNEKLNQVYTD